MFSEQAVRIQPPKFRDGVAFKAASANCNKACLDPSRPRSIIHDRDVPHCNTRIMSGAPMVEALELSTLLSGLCEQTLQGALYPSVSNAILFPELDAYTILRDVMLHTSIILNLRSAISKHVTVANSASRMEDKAPLIERREVCSLPMEEILYRRVHSGLVLRARL